MLGCTPNVRILEVVAVTYTFPQNIGITANLVSGDWNYSILDDGTVNLLHYLGSDFFVIIPSTINRYTMTTLSQGTFMYNEDVIAIYIPEMITDFSGQSFYCCDYLQMIFVSENNPVYQSIDGVFFDKAGTTLMCLPCGYSGTYVVPDKLCNCRFSL